MVDVVLPAGRHQTHPWLRFSDRAGSGSGSGSRSTPGSRVTATGTVSNPPALCTPLVGT